MPDRDERPATLYVSYDGILEPLGESQALAYVERLAADYAITLLTFEKPPDLADRSRMEAMRSRLTARRITWRPLRYHKSPPVLSTAFDVFAGIRAGRRAARGAGLVHARGYVAALIAMTVARTLGAAFIFDMRGFWADEKVDGGHWAPGSSLYRATKGFERRFFEAADAIVSLTNAGVAEFPGLGYQVDESTPIEVIPTCTDLARFTPGPKDQALAATLGLDGGPVIGVSGTTTNWYLRQPMLESLALLVREVEGGKVLVVTRDDREQLAADARAAGIPDERLVITTAGYDRMPEFMRLMDVGLFFIKPCFSKKGSCATKLAEFLATGVPVIINDGVGDSGAIVAGEGVGVVLPDATTDAMRRALPAVRAVLADAQVHARCRATAARYFDVEEGTRTYRRLYDRVLTARAAAGSRLKAKAI